jgi:hypothetical protein
LGDSTGCDSSVLRRIGGITLTRTEITRARYEREHLR